MTGVIVFVLRLCCCEFDGCAGLCLTVFLRVPDLHAETKEECLHAKLIHNIHRRFPGYQPQDDEYPLCDYYISPGWYTFCGQVLSSNLTGCGTVFNWIRTGALPDDGPDLVNVCMTQKEEGKCQENSQVNASKCHDGTYVFYLIDTQSCPEAYCIESAVDRTNE
ncbi:hypothetical protein MAR_034045, partial [Mya arenaria]